MEPIKLSLQKRLNQRALGRTAQAAYVCHIANQIADNRFKAVSFKNGALTISASSPAAAQDVAFDRDIILKEINAELPQALVRRVNVKTISDR